MTIKNWSKSFLQHQAQEPCWEYWENIKSAAVGWIAQNGKEMSNKTRPAWVYLDGQLMSEWVSPSASVWRSQSVVSMAPALWRWRPSGRHEWEGNTTALHTELLMSEPALKSTKSRVYQLFLTGPSCGSEIGLRSHTEPTGNTTPCILKPEAEGLRNDLHECMSRYITLT